jgi:hypothetical protein
MKLKNESFTEEKKTRVLGFRVKIHSGLFHDPTRFTRPNSFEEQKRPSTTILHRKRDPDCEKAQKRP